MPEHDHKDYATATSVICQRCGKPHEVCAYCNETWHNCEIKEDLPVGYRVVAEFPDYIVNRQATVRHSKTQRLCVLVRVSKDNHAMINISKNGKKYTRPAQGIRDAAFPDTVE
jgi:hypothetical protein